MPVGPPTHPKANAAPAPAWILGRRAPQPDPPWHLHIAGEGTVANHLGAGQSRSGEIEFTEHGVAFGIVLVAAAQEAGLRPPYRNPRMGRRQGHQWGGPRRGRARQFTFHHACPPRTRLRQDEQPGHVPGSPHSGLDFDTRAVRELAVSKPDRRVIDQCGEDCRYFCALRRYRASSPARSPLRLGVNVKSAPRCSSRSESAFASTGAGSARSTPRPTSTTRPTALGQPFTRWSVRKLASYLRRVRGRVIRVGREALRTLLIRRGITFQRTKTWKESNDPDFDAKLDRIEHVLDRFPDRVFAFDEFGPLGIRPTAGSGWVPRAAGPLAGDLPAITRNLVFPWLLLGRRRHPLGRQPASQGHRPHLGRAAVDPQGPPGRRYVILDNLSAHKNWRIRNWARRNRVELCFTPTYTSWANPIEAHFGPLRQFTIANSDDANHIVQTRALHAYLRWRNANTRDPDVLEAQRCERARVRSEQGVRYGGRPLLTAA
jgi:hypothetical protein